MCYKKANHVLFFRPYKDTHDISRVITCTVWDKETNEVARGCAILSLDDEPNDEFGRQLAYNKAARCLAGRAVSSIMLERAWEAIQALKPLELRDFMNNFGMLSWWGTPTPSAYTDAYHDLTREELTYFRRKGYPQLPRVQYSDHMMQLNEERATVHGG